MNLKNLVIAAIFAATSSMALAEMHEGDACDSNGFKTQIIREGDDVFSCKEGRAQKLSHVGTEGFHLTYRLWNHDGDLTTGTMMGRDGGPSSFYNGREFNYVSACSPSSDGHAVQPTVSVIHTGFLVTLLPLAKPEGKILLLVAAGRNTLTGLNKQQQGECVVEVPSLTDAHVEEWVTLDDGGQATVKLGTSFLTVTAKRIDEPRT